jgi:hypothetical protein
MVTSAQLDEPTHDTVEQAIAAGDTARQRE